MAEIKATHGMPKGDGRMDPAIFITIENAENCDDQYLTRGFAAALRQIAYWLNNTGYDLIKTTDYKAPERSTSIKYEINVANAKELNIALRERTDLQRKVEILKAQNKGLRTRIKKLTAK